MQLGGSGEAGHRGGARGTQLTAGGAAKGHLRCLVGQDQCLAGQDRGDWLYQGLGGALVSAPGAIYNIVQGSYTTTSLKISLPSRLAEFPVLPTIALAQPDPIISQAPAQ